MSSRHGVIALNGRRRACFGMAALMPMLLMATSTSPQSTADSPDARQQQKNASAAFELVGEALDDDENVSAGGGFELISSVDGSPAERLEGAGFSLTGMIVPKAGESRDDADIAVVESPSALMGAVDQTNDGKVDAADLLLYLERSAAAVDPSDADLDGDGVATGSDVLALVRNW